jgi:hypothetical protein
MVVCFWLYVFGCIVVAKVLTKVFPEVSTESQELLYVVLVV